MTVKAMDSHNTTDLCSAFFIAMYNHCRKDVDYTLNFIILTRREYRQAQEMGVNPWTFPETFCVLFLCLEPVG
jgi:hypothetical protein